MSIKGDITCGLYLCFGIHQVILNSQILLLILNTGKASQALPHSASWEKWLPTGLMLIFFQEIFGRLMNQAVWVTEMYKIVNFQISFIIAWVTILMKKIQNVTYVIPHHPWGTGSRTPSDTKIWGCSSPCVIFAFNPLSITPYTLTHVWINLQYLIQGINAM